MINENRKSKSELKLNGLFMREILIRNCLKKSYFEKSKSSQSDIMCDPNYQQKCLTLSMKSLMPAVEIPLQLLSQVQNYLANKESIILEGNIIPLRKTGAKENRIGFEMNESPVLKYLYITDFKDDPKLKENFVEGNNFIFVPSNQDPSITSRSLKQFVEDSLKCFYSKLCVYRGKFIKNIEESSSVVFNLRGIGNALQMKNQINSEKDLTYMFDGFLSPHNEVNKQKVDEQSNQFNNAFSNKEDIALISEIESLSECHHLCFSSLFCNIFLFTASNALVVSIFPNIKFELDRIDNKSILVSDLASYLVGKPTPQSPIYSGLISLDKKNRIIILPMDSEGKSSQVHGIWIKIPKHHKKFNGRLNEPQLNEILSTYKPLIAERCTNFLLRCDLEEVNSPSPNKNLFYMVIFLNNKPYYFEVKSKIEAELDNRWVAAISEVPYNREAHIEFGDDGPKKLLSIRELLSLFEYQSKESLILNSSGIISIDNRSDFKDSINEIFDPKPTYDKFKEINLPYNPGNQAFKKQTDIIKKDKLQETLILSMKDDSEVQSRLGFDNKQSKSENSSSGMGHKYNNSNYLKSKYGADQPIINQQTPGLKSNSSCNNENNLNFNMNMDGKLNGNNVLEIIFDQAKNIRHLQEQINHLTKELNKVKSENYPPNCLCGKSTSSEINKGKTPDDASSLSVISSKLSNSKTKSDYHQTYIPIVKESSPKKEGSKCMLNDYSIQVPKAKLINDSFYAEDSVDETIYT